MTTRFVLMKENPKAYELLGELDKLGRESNIPRNLQELIKIYASNLNHCAFCIDMHTKEALEIGETLQRIAGVNAWREAPLYSDKERVVLELVEEVTFIHQHGVSDAVYDELTKHYNEKEIGELYVLIATINAYNRLGIMSRLQPKIDK
ncbi:carboxymuconolactone decarboxylase family protein [Listeria booriae]|uniref:Carboxymuconolactone decarboxylase family protein n=1 Tax=Listeria booriae TaxID=1552123 RepID=A0A842AKG1_9LIST|nr:carboxymuconolactone decarboxylase family protein [Listeria booriae]MBC1401389.1 carboxymuconolactone decarboxylase family protein [Listeria booriae]MBC1616458.1 carboxymuconolactone decarboxylase family protein [Listeria booriae]